MCGSVYYFLKYFVFFVLFVFKERATTVFTYVLYFSLNAVQNVGVISVSGLIKEIHFLINTDSCFLTSEDLTFSG